MEVLRRVELGGSEATRTRATRRSGRAAHPKAGLGVQPRAPAAIFRCGDIEDMQMMGKAQEMPTARRGLITFKEGLKHLRVGRTKASELINAGKIIAYGQPKVDAFLTRLGLPRRPPGRKYGDAVDTIRDFMRRGVIIMTVSTT